MASSEVRISPISFSQGISRQTILHEATHAAQSCPNGILKPLDLELTISPLLNKEIQRILLKNYKANQFLIEKEAYSLQTQKNAVEILVKSQNFSMSALGFCSPNPLNFDSAADRVSLFSLISIDKLSNLT